MNRETGLSKVIYTVKYLFLGVMMSSITTPLFETFGLPTSPELIFFPLLYFWQDEFTFTKEWKNRFTLFILIWIFFFLCALLNDRFSVGAILTTGRAYLYMGIFAVWTYAVKMDKKLYDKIYLLSLGSLLGWTLVISLRHAGILPVVNKGVNYGNMVAIPLCISLVFALKATKKSIGIALLLNIFLSFTTALRRQIAVSAISFLLSYFFVIKQKGSYKLHGPVIVILTALFLAFPYIEESVKQYDTYTYQRIFERTRNAGNGKDHGDQVRIDNYIYVYENFGDLQVPHGYVSKRTFEDGELGRFVDCPLYELLYTFGSLVVALAMLFFLFRLALHVLYYYRLGLPHALIWLTSGVACFFLVFVESTFLAYTYTTPMTGIIIGALCRNPRDLIEE